MFKTCLVQIVEYDPHWPQAFEELRVCLMTHIGNWVERRLQLVSHHLYVCPPGSLGMANHLAFCDYLRSHPEEARDYAALKRQLAQRYPIDMDAYCEAKTGFIAKILERAGYLWDRGVDEKI